MKEQQTLRDLHSSVLWPPHAVWWGFADMRLNRKGGSDREGFPAVW